MREADSSGENDIAGHAKGVEASLCGFVSRHCYPHLLDTLKYEAMRRTYHRRRLLMRSIFCAVWSTSGLLQSSTNDNLMREHSYHHTLHFVSGFMSEPFGQPKDSAKWG